MKKIEIYRGKDGTGYTCTNGDVYDSSLTLFAESGEELYTTYDVNTDSTKNYKGGILAPGLYYGIVGYRSNKKRVIKLFSGTTDISKIKDDSFLTEAMLTLPSTIPNPNHGKKKVIAHVQIHAGGISWDFSHGCITILNDPDHKEYDKLMELVVDNEILVVHLI